MWRRKKLKVINYLAIVLLSYITGIGCVEQDKHILKQYTVPAQITVDGDRFVDNNGRQVILNGINVVSKSSEEQYLFKAGPEFYTNMKRWGFNCIRFYICWDGFEPEPGVYNEHYLQEIDKRIQWAADNGLFVILDMHQDLFSVKYSNGAPEWATLDEGKTHTTGDVWSDAYIMSEAVHTAFDNFWANKPAPDGIGVQDHYANLWKHIAKRYANNSTVIGYDIMNEPFAGSSALYAMPALLTAYGELVYTTTGKMLTEGELEAIWGDVNKRTEALKFMSTRANYSHVIDALYPFNKEFESTHLQAMYQKVANAIREVDTKHILFLEHSYFSNMGVRSSIERVLLPDGTPDPLVAYAPHGYDLVTDTEAAAASNSERITFIYDRIKEKGHQLKMPVWLGEWGAYYNHSDGIVPVARYAVSLIEKNLFGNAYWSYDPGKENLEYFQKALLRPYPAYTNGELLNYEFNHESLVLTTQWNEAKENTAPTVLYVPWLSRLNREELVNDGHIDIEKMEGTDAGWVIVHPTNRGGNRTVKLQFEQ